MKYQIYVKKEIKSKADMPKEEGLYLAHDKNQYHTKYTSFAPIAPNNIGVKQVRSEWWIENIDWYLQSVELDLPDDEEIDKDALSIKYSNDSYKLGFYDGIKTFRDKIKNQLK